MDAATVTARALQRCIIALIVIFVASVVLSPPSHVSHYCVGGAYLLVLFGGLIGAYRRAKCMLRLYWVAQFIVLLLTLASIVLGIVVMVQQMKAQPHVVDVNVDTSVEDDSTVTSHEVKRTADDTTSTTTSTMDGSETEIQHHETMATPKNSPAYILLNVAYLVAFLMVLAIKVRSMLLAQKLVKQMDEMPYLEDSQIELESQQLNNSSDYNVVETQQYTQPTVAPQPVYLVPAHYLPNGQPDMSNVPLILVDQYGNPINPAQQ